MIATTFNLAKLFYDKWVRHHRMLQFIISDKETFVPKGGDEVVV